MDIKKHKILISLTGNDLEILDAMSGGYGRSVVIGEAIRCLNRMKNSVKSFKEFDGALQIAQAGNDI